MSKSQIFKRGVLADGRAFAFITAITAFCIPVIKNGVQLPIILMAVSWVFTSKRRMGKNLWVILLFAGLYLFHLFAMLYTSNIDRGMSDLEQKMSLFIFPVLFGTAAPFTISQFRRVISFLCFGTVVAVVIALVSSLLDFQLSGDYTQFYMKYFSPVHHPSYLALFMNVSIFAMAYRVLFQPISAGRKMWLWSGIIFLSLCLVFPTSKMGFINFAFYFILILGIYFYKKQPFNGALILFIAIGLGLGFLIVLNPVSRVRMAASVKTLEQGRSTNEIESNAARIIAWKTVFDLLKKKPFGVGTGDINDVLVENYRKNGYDILAERELNPHNEYLQLSLAQGIPAALLLIFGLALTLRRYFNQANWVPLFFVLSICIHFTVESMLEKQSGVVYFAFFNAFFFFHTHKDQA